MMRSALLLVLLFATGCSSPSPAAPSLRGAGGSLGSLQKRPGGSDEAVVRQSILRFLEANWSALRQVTASHYIVEDAMARPFHVFVGVFATPNDVVREFQKLLNEARASGVDEATIYLGGLSETDAEEARRRLEPAVGSGPSRLRFAAVSLGWNNAEGVGWRGIAGGFRWGTPSE